MIYDSFTITALLGLEALEFCEKGEGGLRGGQPVRVVFEKIDENVTLPKFRPE